MLPAPIHSGSRHEHIRPSADIVVDRNRDVTDEIKGILVPGAVQHRKQAPQLLADPRPIEHTQENEYKTTQLRQAVEITISNGSTITFNASTAATTTSHEGDDCIRIEFLVH